MAELIYPTSLELSGPWLISAAQLDALDQIVDEEMESLKASAEKRLSRNLEKRLADRLVRDQNLSEEEKAKLLKNWQADERRYPFYTIKREVRVKLADEKSVFSRTFREAASHPEIAFSRVVSFNMNLENGETRCRLSIGGNGTDLQLSVYGDDRQEREDLFNALRGWIHNVQAPRWQRLWNRFVDFGFHWFAGAAVCFIILVIDAVGHFAFSQGSPYTAAAHALVAKGVTPNDVPKAIEMILALESNYNPSPRAVTWGAQEIELVILIFCGMLSIRPRFEVGLGKGVERISRWNLWTRIVAVSLPLFVISTVAGNLLLNLFHLH